jgi:hypothetical protein
MTVPKSEKDFDPTRQQLEDLQALLDRMLQIPVLQPTDVPDDVLPARRVKSPSLLVPSGSREDDPQHVLPAPRLEPPVAPHAPPSLLKPSAQAIGVAPTGAPGPAQPGEAKSRPLSSIVVAAIPSPPSPLSPIVQIKSELVDWPPIAISARLSSPAARPRQYDPAPPQSLALAPLRAINWCFDRTVSPLGAAGRWLRSRTGRSVLGWTGILLVLVAAGWGTTEAAWRWLSP